jgi:hypothetical protein
VGVRKERGFRQDEIGAMPVIGSLPDCGLSGVNACLLSLFRALRREKLNTTARLQGNYAT